MEDEWLGGWLGGAKWIKVNFFTTLTLTLCPSCAAAFQPLNIQLKNFLPSALPLVLNIQFLEIVSYLLRVSRNLGGKTLIPRIYIWRSITFVEAVVVVFLEDAVSRCQLC